MMALHSIDRQNESKSANTAIEGEVADYGGVCDSGSDSPVGISNE